MYIYTENKSYLSFYAYKYLSILPPRLSHHSRAHLLCLQFVLHTPTSSIFAKDSLRQYYSIIQYTLQQFSKIFSVLLYRFRENAIRSRRTILGISIKSRQDFSEKLDLFQESIAKLSVNSCPFFIFAFVDLSQILCSRNVTLSRREILQFRVNFNNFLFLIFFSFFQENRSIAQRVVDHICNTKFFSHIKRSKSIYKSLQLRSSRKSRIRLIEIPKSRHQTRWETTTEALALQHGSIIIIRKLVLC